MTTTNAKRFELGRLVATPAALQALERAGVTPLSLVRRHAAGDWGECDAHDRQANEDAVLNGDRIFSVYLLPTREKVWVITEHDGTSTCVLTPACY
jgi:hypothetical protein